MNAKTNPMKPASANKKAAPTEDELKAAEENADQAAETAQKEAQEAIDAAQAHIDSEKELLEKEQAAYLSDLEKFEAEKAEFEKEKEEFAAEKAKFEEEKGKAGATSDAGDVEDKPLTGGLNDVKEIFADLISFKSPVRGAFNTRPKVAESWNKFIERVEKVQKKLK